MTEPTNLYVKNTRMEILLAAQRLFAENGFHGTSMRQIAQAAGIALGGIYNHFSSKEEIFTTIFLELHPYRKMVNEVMQAQGDNIEDLLHDIIRRLEPGLLDHPDQFLALMFIELVEFKGQHISNFFQEVFPRLVEASQRIFADQENLRDLPLFIELRALFGLVFSYFIVEWLFGEMLPAEGRENGLEHLVDIFLHGVLKPNHPTEASSL